MKILVIILKLRFCMYDSKGCRALIRNLLSIFQKFGKTLHLGTTVLGGYFIVSSWSQRCASIRLWSTICGADDMWAYYQTGEFLRRTKIKRAWLWRDQYGNYCRCHLSYHLWGTHSNRPFPSSPQPPSQSEAKCEVFIMKISFHSYWNWN